MKVNRYEEVQESFRTVEELINVLQNLPPDYVVSTYGYQCAICVDHRTKIVKMDTPESIRDAIETFNECVEDGMESPTVDVSAESSVPEIMNFVFGAANRESWSGKKVWEMTPEEVQRCCKEGKIREVGSVGDTFGDGKYTYTIIGINQDIPCDSKGNPLSKDSYKDVLTVMCLGAPVGPGNGKPVLIDASKTPWGIDIAPMNSSDTNDGSWKDSDMRKNIMPAYLAMLPGETQKVINYVQKITGQVGGVNITTSDKCFLLSEKEIFGERRFSTHNEQNANFQYQYFANIATSTANRNIISDWWLRSPYCDYRNGFCSVGFGSAYNDNASISRSVFSAMCIY